MNFREKYSLEERISQSKRFRAKYPDRIPIVISPGNSSVDKFLLKKYKYLVPNEVTIGEFMCAIRDQIELPKEKAMFLFVNNVLPPTSSRMCTIFEQHKDDDGFLYMTYGLENTFG